MDGETRFYQRPGFYWLVLFLAIIILYFVTAPAGRPLREHVLFITLDVALYGALLLIWLAFFAQFILPVRKAADRQKIFDRILVYITGGHGPAIFIENGHVKERTGESKKSGPGLIWLDTASAAVLRTAVAYTRAIGPGVHFTSKFESIAGAIDLHTQTQFAGPWEKDKSFDEKKQDQSEEEYDQIQNRRQETSGLTRDGIEVVPNLLAIFRLDATPSTGNQLGSHFGYDKEAAFKAIAGEGVNLKSPSDLVRNRVAWNQLPVIIAIDLWREYLSKFTLNELFESTQPIPTSAPALPKPDISDTTALYEPVQVGPKGNTISEAVAEMLHVLNQGIKSAVDTLDPTQAGPTAARPAFGRLSGGSSERPAEPQTETALETIVRMVRERMTKPEVEVLDDFGRRTGVMRPSLEYQLLKKRGLRVLTIVLLNPRFAPSVEDQLVRQWATTWLQNAKDERDRIDRHRSLTEMQEKEEAFREYARAISQEIVSTRPGGAKETLKTLLSKSRRDIARNDRLHKRMSTEIAELTEAIQWVEKS